MAIGQLVRTTPLLEVTGDTIILAAGLNFPAFVTYGLTLESRLIVKMPQAMGLAVEQGPSYLVTRQGPGMEIVHTSVVGTHQSYVITATESTGSDWESVTQSQGAENGAYATLTEGIALVQGSLFGQFVNQATGGRNALAIDKVSFRSYYQLANFLLPGSSLTIAYTTTFNLPTPIWHTVKTLTGNPLGGTNENHLASGELFDITASGPDGLGAPWGWSNLSGIGFAVRYQGTILVDAGLSLVRVDATRLELEMSSVQPA